MRILRGTGSRCLPCGCLVGFYETYDGRTVAIVDARGAACEDGRHRVDARLTLPLDDSTVPKEPRTGDGRHALRQSS